MTYEIRKLGGDWMPFVMDRPIGWATCITRNDSEFGASVGMAMVWRMRGFYTPMENKLILSTQFGSGNYCDNYGVTFNAEREFTEVCGTAELACYWDPESDAREAQLLEWPDGDSVAGWFPAERWWELVGELSRLPTGSSLTGHPALRAVLRSERT